MDVAAINLGMPKVPEVLAPRRKSRQIKVGSVLVGGSALVIGAVVIGAYMFWPRRSAA